MAFIYRPSIECDNDCDVGRDGEPNESRASMWKRLLDEGWRRRKIPSTGKVGDMCPWCIDVAQSPD